VVVPGVELGLGGGVGGGLDWLSVGRFPSAGRLRGLLDVHTTSVQDSGKTQNAPRTRRGWMKGRPRASRARWVGEHLVCSPCGRWPLPAGGRRSCVRAGRSGGAAVALAASKPYIISTSGNFKPWRRVFVLPATPCTGQKPRDP